MNIDKKNITIQLLALLGLGLSIKLAFIYYDANFNAYALPSFCAINEFLDCDKLAKTPTAQFSGIPLAYWGIFFYITVLFLTIVNKLKNIKFLGFLEVFKTPNAYISTLASFAFIISMLLAGISLIKLHMLCVLCLVTYFIDFVIALIASGYRYSSLLNKFKLVNYTRVLAFIIIGFSFMVGFTPLLFGVGIFLLVLFEILRNLLVNDEKFRYVNSIFLLLLIALSIKLFGIDKSIFLAIFSFLISYIVETNFNNLKTTYFDFIAGVKKYTKTFIVLALIFGGFVAYSGITLKFVPHIKRHRTVSKYSKIKYNPYRVNANLLGSEKADVTIELYSDYVCPICNIQNLILHKVVKEYSNVKVVHYNLPFDKECNEYITINMHPYACYMSKAALAAKKQGNYWGMSSLLYENKPRRKSELDKLLDTLNFDKNQFYKDLASKEVEVELSNDIKRATLDLNIDATPTMFINGDKVVGMRLDYELRDLLNKYGAKRR